jgi:hypothetical protein
MTSRDALKLSLRLDDHHFPETNGRTNVCRRCGFGTTGPAGNERHTAAEERPTRARRWLDNQTRLSGVAQAEVTLRN